MAQSATAASLVVRGSSLGNNLQQMLMADDIVPGDAPSYQLCKTILAYHPLGAKMTDSPISMAQSQERIISVPKGPEDRLKEAFTTEWEALSADRHIFNTARLSRAYGVSSLALLVQGVPVDRPIAWEQLWNADLSFNVFDPLNTAGSLVLNQDPNALDFQKVRGIAVQGKSYHRSRTVTMLNEDPLYIEYTTSAFGYVGRSVFQRALFPLKSFLQTMITDDMVSLKAGVLVAKQRQPGSIIDQAMAFIAGIKRTFVQSAQTNNVLSIGLDEDIESINLQNLEGPAAMARKDILDNIATAADMPAIILNQETFAEGFGEGTEDAKRVSQFIDRIRIWMRPLYAFFDQVVMHRAWNPEFYKTIQADFPDLYANKTYRQAFYEWKNSFTAEWPNLIEEPDSEKVKVDDVRLKAIIAMVEVLAPMIDPENKVLLIQWACDNFNSLKLMFSDPLDMDWEALEDFTQEQAEQQKQLAEQGGTMGGPGGGQQGGEQEPKPPKPFADSQRVDRAVKAFGDAAARLAAGPERKALPRGRQAA